MKQLTQTEFELDYETGAYVLDFRLASDFIEGFIPGSYYTSPRFLRSNIREVIISPEETIVFIAPGSIVSDIHTELEKKQYMHINGWLKGGFETWKANGNKIDIVISIEADELMLDMKYDDPQIIDIRSAEEFDAMHLQGAENIPVENLVFNLDDLPKDGVFYIYCEDGELSLSIVSCLKSQGLHNYYHIRGGFVALRQNEASMET
jgi:hydroxyacylglutathione hydrolase